jgi:riboflavin biosynthesis pyrimidine reductase
MRLLPIGPGGAGDAGNRAADDVETDQLAELYGRPQPGDGSSWVRANFVSTLDGAATGSDNLAKSITSGADQQVFNVLRALADVVLVGAGTVAAERYRRLAMSPVQQRVRTAAGVTEPVSLAIVSRTLRLPARVLESVDGGGPVLVICPSGCDPSELGELKEKIGPDQVIEAGAGLVDPALAISALADRGLRQVLCEGGPSLMALLVASGKLDELCLTWSPVTVGGSGPRILNGAPVDGSWRLGHLLEQDSTLISRWLRTDA